MLKYKLESGDFEKLSDAEKTFYKQDGDIYALQIEGAVDKSKVDEFRENNIKLQNQLKQFEGVDMEKYNKALEKDRQLRDKELIDKGEFDTLVQERTKSIVSDYEAKLEALKNNFEQVNQNYSRLVAKVEIDGEAHKAFAQHKIAPDAQEAALAQIRLKFQVDNGKAIAKDGDNILTGANGNLTIDEFVSGLPEIFKLKSEGGGGAGNTSTQGQFNGKSSRDKISSGLSKLMNKQ